MIHTLHTAYHTLFGTKPHDLTDAAIAEAIVYHFDGRKFTTEESLELLNDIVNYVEYPSREKMYDTVGKAEALFEEALPEELRIKYGVGEELHMDEIGVIVANEKREREQKNEMKPH